MQRPLFSVWVGLIILTALRLWRGGDTSPWLPDGGTLAEGSGNRCNRSGLLAGGCVLLPE